MPFWLKQNYGKTSSFTQTYALSPIKSKSYKHIIKVFLSLPSLPSIVASQCLWLNKYIKMDDKAIFISSLSAKRIDLMGQLSQNNQQIKRWVERKLGFDLIKTKSFSLLKSLMLSLVSGIKFLEITLKVFTSLLSRIAIW